MPAASPCFSPCRGFTLTGTLGSLAVITAMMAICAPIVARRIRAHAQDAERMVRHAEASIVGSIGQAVSTADAAARQLAAVPPLSAVRDQGAAAWPSSPADPLAPCLDGADEWDCFRPRWPLRENRPPPFWRPPFRPRLVERRLWPRPPAWRLP